MVVMGRNFAFNIESCGYIVFIFNCFCEKMEEVIVENLGKKLVFYYMVKEFVEFLEMFCCILLMVKVGVGMDVVIDFFKLYFDKGDIIIDGGNIFFQDIICCNCEFLVEGFNFIGIGVFGGEEGVLKGFFIMFGGQKEVYELVVLILIKIVVVVEDGELCVIYIGVDGVGYYVKMVYNGIEYGDMQLIVEVYFLFKGGLNFINEELVQIFIEWNNGELSSYLIDIIKDIFIKKDEDGNYLVDVILDEVVNKGIGKWISQSVLDFGELLLLIIEFVFVRYIFFLKDQCVVVFKVFFGS